MVILNICFLAICLVSIYVVKKKHLGIFVNIIYFELLLYSLVATILVGNTFGYRLYVFCLIPLIFFSEYISKIRNKFNINANLHSAIAIIFYFFETFIGNLVDPIYSGVPNNIIFLIYISNTVCTFVYISIYLTRFSKVVNIMEDRLHSKAEYDELTKLYNRHKTTELLTNIYNDFKTNKSEKWVSIIDIDDFKKINDQYGHNCGDYVLRELANIIKKVAYKNNYNVSRWGGEEFLIFGELNDNTFDLLENLRKTIEQYNFSYNHINLKVTITAGVSIMDEYSTIDSWIDKADSNLYIGKKSTKNCVIYDG